MTLASNCLAERTHPIADELQRRRPTQRLLEGLLREVDDPAARGLRWALGDV